MKLRLNHHDALQYDEEKESKASDVAVALVPEVVELSFAGLEIKSFNAIDRRHAATKVEHVEQQQEESHVAKNVGSSPCLGEKVQYPAANGVVGHRQDQNR
eukprot:CAMPEP_0114119570 /NCGR_PEP_ID=MMETSP0043_2-20121206/6185_1 /TAXON_ID=464988 /ORGANISM="Hemiselmis andersenii, Strain CCMP644" /LENGTH=100 /DNA_ID=CAMNT_0001212133 /DNA_START=81 /DNA_END=383 /DNA_ORIENTATION=+